MKIIKRLLIALVVLVVLAVGALLLAPILFKDQIVANVKAGVNKAVTAEVDFADVNLSFLSSFPDVSLTVDELTIVGVDTFAGLPLLTARKAQVDVGFWSVVGNDGNYNIEAVELDDPVVNLKVLSPELANYLVVASGDPTTASDPASAPAAAQINLHHFAVRNGDFVYDDRTTETYLKMTGLNVEGDGDFTDVVFNLDLDATAESLTLRQSGTTYLKKVAAVANGLVNVDLNQSKYTFLDTKARLNALDLIFAGSIDLEDNDDIVFDLDYRAPANDFRQLWSLIPSAYTTGYEDVRTTGTFTLVGTVDGPYNGEREVYPAFTLKSEINDGSVQYPGRPVGINDITALLNVVSPGSDLNKLTVDLPRFRVNLGGDPFSGSFKLATPLSDPRVDARVQGKLDLAKWAQAIPLEGVTELAGLIVADITADRVRQSLIDAARYDEIALTGDLQLTDFVYTATDLPPVRISRARADFTPRAVSVPDFAMTLGRSDLSGGGEITNPLAYFSPDETMRGSFTVRSDFFDADEWMTEETPTTTLSPAETTQARTEPSTTEVFDRFDFDVDATIDQLQYATYRPKDLRAAGNVKPNRLDLRSMAATLGNSSVTGSGTVTDLFDYTFADGVLGGNLTVQSDYLDLADFVTEETAATTTSSGTATAEEAAAVPIPANIALNVDMKAATVKYDNIDLNGVLGKLVLQNGQAVIEDGSAAIFGGRMDFEGAYDTSEPGDPGFRFHYDLKNLDFSSAFAKLNSFALLAPIGKFLRGKFNSNLVLEGKLGADLFPKLSTIDAKGLFETAEAQLAGFDVLQKVGDKLNVDELKGSTTLRNIVTFFLVQDGKVAIEPFDLRIAGFPVNVSGSHGLNQDMDYVLKAAIPRDKIKGNLVTGTALSALDQLAGQANRLGLNLSPGDTLNVAINLGGSISNPTYKFNLLSAQDGQPTTVQDAVVDAARDQVQQEIDNKKEEVTTQVTDRVNAARDLAQARADSLKRVAQQRAQILQDSIRRAAANETERIKDQAARELANRLRLDSLRRDSLLRNVPGADAIRDELDRFNPFKKKKKDGGR